MCEYCTLLRYVLTKSQTNDCPACASLQPDEGIPSACASCVVYALINQNIFAERWNEMQHALAPAQQPQIYPSINGPQPGLRPSSLKTHRASPPTHRAINLDLTERKLAKIRHVLTVTPNSNNCINVHIIYPTIPLLTKHLHKLQGMVRSGMDHTLSLWPIFHHLHITAMSPL